MDRGDVALLGLDGETPVFALARQAVLEDHHRRHDVLALQVGDVVALDAQRRLVEVERVGDLLQRLAAGGQVAGAADLVLRQGLLGVALDGLHQRLLVAALGHAHLDAGAALLGQQLGDGLGVGRQVRDEHLAGHRVGAGLAVHLQQELLDQLAGRALLDLVDDPAALAADASAAYVEDLDGGLQRIFGQGDDVGVGALPEHDRLLLQRPLQRLDVVAQPGRPLVFLLGGGLAHLLLQPLDEAGGVAGHEVAEVFGQVAVLVGADPADAGRRALVDVAEQARPADLPGPLEHPGAARAYGEDAQQQVDRLADGPGVGVGAEVAGALALGAAHDLHAREVLAHGHREVGVGLVVAVLDVEARVELLDPGVFELQRLHLGADDRPVDVGGRGQHRLRARMQRGEVGEVGVEPLAQALGLADVDHPAVRVPEPVDPWGLGNRPRLGPETQGAAR